MVTVLDTWHSGQAQLDHKGVQDQSTIPQYCDLSLFLWQCGAEIRCWEIQKSSLAVTGRGGKEESLSIQTASPSARTFPRAKKNTLTISDQGVWYRRLTMTYIDSCHPGTHPSGSLRLSKLAPGQFVTWRVVVTEVNYQKTEIKKPRQMAGFSYLALDDDLLSHGEAPHYHRR